MLLNDHLDNLNKEMIAMARTKIRVDDFLTPVKVINGINIYEFEYKDKKYGEGRYRGVIAQEVPWASVQTKEYLGVDYSKIDVNFERII